MNYRTTWCLFAAIVASVPFVGWAQTFPTKPIRLVVPFPPGGTSDVAARLVANEMEKELGQPLIVDNRPGAGGTTGTGAVAKAAPDGYLIGMSAPGPTIILPTVRDVGYDAARELAPIGLMYAATMFLSVRSDSPFKGLKDLVAYAKENPGKVTYSHSGLGGIQNLAVELLSQETAIQLVNVPYKGEAPAYQDFLGGRVDVSTATLTLLAPQLKSGSVRVLTQFGDTRDSAVADAPTAREQGFATIATSWVGMFAPARTPPAIVSRLSETMGTGLRAPATREKLAAAGLAAVGSTPQAFADFFRIEREKWSGLVRRLNLKIE